MKNNSFTTSPVKLAQIVTSTTPYYVLHAYNHEGYLVQRRRRDAPPAPPDLEDMPWEQRPRYEFYHHPYYNQAALTRAGLTRQHIDEWLQTPGHNALSEPAFAACCLRWGENPDDYFVREYSLFPGNEQEIEFEPHSCWDSGLTYYRLISPRAASLPVLQAMQAQGLLSEHTHAIGSEGSWPGWYSTSWASLQRALAEHHLEPVIAQVELVHWVRLHAADETTIWTEQYHAEQEALDRYAQFDEHPAALPTKKYPRLEHGRAQSVRGVMSELTVTAQKYLQSTTRSRYFAPQPFTRRPTIPETYPSFQLTGRVFHLTDISQVSPAFVKRELILAVAKSPSLGTDIAPEKIKIEFSQDRVVLLDEVALGDDVTIHFHILGREWSRNEQTSYLVTLSGWRLENQRDPPATYDDEPAYDFRTIRLGPKIATAPYFPGSSPNDTEPPF